MEEIRILMFGPSSVGKTSLLTSMYMQLINEVEQTKFSIKANDRGLISMLEDKEEQIKDIFEKNSILVQTGLESTQNIEEYKFNLLNAELVSFKLNKLKNTPFLSLNFIDIPGEWIGKNANQSNIEKIKEQVDISDILLIAIDTPAMMEEPRDGETLGRYMKQINNHFLMNEELREIFSSLKKNKMILFCPIKCEKYFSDKELLNTMNNNIKIAYKPFLSFLKNNFSENIAVVISPVLTLGGIQFLYIDKTKNPPVFQYSKISQDSKYSPKYCEQPLRYIISYLLSSYLKKQSLTDKFVGWWNGLNDKLKSEITNFSSGVIKDPPFEILQGEHLLK